MLLLERWLESASWRSSPSLSPPKNLFQQVGGLGGRVTPDFALFYAERIEESIQRFFHDILVEIEFVGQGTSSRSVLDHALILLDDADFLQGVMDDRRE